MSTKLETLDIACPYCKVGHIRVPAAISVGANGVQQTQVRGMHDPRKCETCGCYSMLVPEVKFNAITLERAKEMGRHVA